MPGRFSFKNAKDRSITEIFCARDFRSTEKNQHFVSLIRSSYKFYFIYLYLKHKDNILITNYCSKEVFYVYLVLYFLFSIFPIIFIQVLFSLM